MSTFIKLLIVKFDELRSKITLNILYFAYIIILGGILAFLVPPFQKPDEYVHFDKSIAISKGYLFCFQTKPFFTTSLGFVKLENMTKRFQMEWHSENRYPWRSYIEPIFSSKENRVPTTNDKSSFCNLPFISYVPQSLAIKIGELSHFNFLYIFYLGRAVALITCLLWFAYLVKIAPKKILPLLYLVFGLPMTIFQISSYSYDATHIMLGLSIFTYLFLLLDQKETISKTQLIVFFCLVGLFILSKSGGYETYILLPLVLNHKKIASSLKLYLLKYSVFYIFLICSLTFIKLTLAPSILATSSQPYVYPSAQVQYLSENSIKIFSLIANTTITNFEEFLQTGIGVFGWLDWYLPIYLYYLYFGIILLVLYKTRTYRFNITPLQLAIFSVIILMTYVEHLLIMYIAWTPVGRMLVQGVQGRYFISSLPLFIVVLSVLAGYILQHRKLAVSILGLGIILSILFSLHNRYYEYSNLFLDYEDKILTLPKNSLQIDNPIQTTIHLDEKKSLGALKIYISSEPIAVTKPYKLSILDSKCVNMITSTIMDLSKTTHGYLIESIPKGIGIHLPAICIEIAPYGGINGNSLKVLKNHNNSVEIMPIYRR